MSLADVALQRVTGEVQDFYPGGTYPQKLLAGRAAAQAVLQLYVPNFSWDVPAANEALSQVDAWAQRNQEQLSAELQSNTELLSETIRLQLGSTQAQAFVLGVFTAAAYGMGPWLSGYVDRAVAGQVPGIVFGPETARQDAEHRLRIFGSIVRMHEDGELQKIFVPPHGIAPVIVWAIAIAFIATAAIVAYFVSASHTVTVNNRTMDDLCKKAQERGDTAVVQDCVAATANLQKSALDVGGIASLLGTGVKVVLLLAAVYLGVKYVVPAFMEKRGKKAVPELQS